jgi:hypothetical protein
MSQNDWSAQGMSVAVDTPTIVSPNKPLLVLLAALGFALGVLPYLMLIGRPAWVVWVAAGAALIAVFALRTHASNATASPTLGEWLLGSWSAVAHSAALSLLGMMVYGLFYWVIRVGGFLLGMDAIATAIAWAEWASGVPVALALIPMSYTGVTVLATSLYPPLAGTRSPFFALAANPRKWVWVAAIGLAALGGALWLATPREPLFAVLLTLILFYSSFPLLPGSQGKGGVAGKTEAESAVRAMFRAGGYEILEVPDQGDAEGNVLAKEVDFLARGEGRLLAVAVKRRAAASKPAEWQMAIPLRAAVNIVQEKLSARGMTVGAVSPCLVLVGGFIDDSLRAFASSEGVVLLNFRSQLPEPITTEALAEFELQLNRSRASNNDPRPAGV